MAKSYNEVIVNSYFRDHGLPKPVYEYHFALPRKWRFDLAWPEAKLALEVQGGIFVRGRHTQGRALVKEWEKLNRAACLGYRILYVQPDELCMVSTILLLKEAFSLL